MTHRIRVFLIGAALLTVLAPSYVTVFGQSSDTGPYTLRQTLGRGPVRSVAWRPAGDVIAVGGAPGVWLYAFRLGDPPGLGDRGLLQGHTKAVYDLDFNRDGSRLVSVSHDMTVRVWDVAAQAELFALSGHTDLVVAVDWSPAGDVIASGGYDGTLRLWSPVTGAALAVIEAGGGWVDDVAFNRDGSILASATRDGVLRLWDLASGASVAAVDAHPGGVSAVKWSPDGSLIATAGRDGRLRLWRDDLTPVLDIPAHGDVIYDLAWNPVDGTLATASWDDVGVWSAADGRPLHTLTGVDRRVYHVAWNPDGTVMATVNWDSTVRLWDVAAETVIASQPEHMDVIVWVGWDHDEVRAATLDGRLLIWQVPSGRWIGGGTVETDAGLPSLATNASGTRTFAIDAGGTVRIMGRTDGGGALIIATLPGRSDAAAWSPDGTQIAVAQRNGTITIWGDE